MMITTSSSAAAGGCQYFGDTSRSCGGTSGGPMRQSRSSIISSGDRQDKNVQ